MVPDETENEKQAENGKCHIFHEQLLKVDSKEEPTVDFDLYAFVLLVTTLRPVSHIFLEICHNFRLFAFFVLNILVALRTVSDRSIMAPN